MPAIGIGGILGMKVIPGGTFAASQSWAVGTSAGCWAATRKFSDSTSMHLPPSTSVTGQRPLAVE